MYIILFNKIRENADAVPHGREGYFFGASGEHNLYDVGKAVAEALYALGKGQGTEPTTFTKEEIDEYFGGSVRFYIVMSGCESSFVYVE